MDEHFDTEEYKQLKRKYTRCKQILRTLSPSAGALYEYYAAEVAALREKYTPIKVAQYHSVLAKARSCRKNATKKAAPMQTELSWTAGEWV